MMVESAWTVIQSWHTSMYLSIVDIVGITLS